MLFRLVLLGCKEGINVRERPKAKPSRQLEGRKVGGKSITESLTGSIFSQFKSRKHQHVPNPETNTTLRQTRVLATVYILTVFTS